MRGNQDVPSLRFFFRGVCVWGGGGGGVFFRGRGLVCFALFLLNWSEPFCPHLRRSWMASHVIMQMTFYTPIDPNQ